MTLIVNYSLTSALAGPAPIRGLKAILEMVSVSGVLGLHEQSDGFGKDFEICINPPTRHSMHTADVKRFLTLIDQYYRRPPGKYEPLLIVDGSHSFFLVRGDIEMQLSWGSDAPDSWMEKVAPLEAFLDSLFANYPKTAGG